MYHFFEFQSFSSSTAALRLLAAAVRVEILHGYLIAVSDDSASIYGNSFIYISLVICSSLHSFWHNFK